MEFIIKGTFEGPPVLTMDGEEVKYESLDIIVMPESSYTDEMGATITYPAVVRISFSVKEKTGNLDVNKWYTAKASACKDGKLVVEEISEEALAAKGKPKPKKCLDCGKPVKDCACDMAEGKVIKGTIGYSIYVNPPAPNTRAYKENMARQIAEGLANV